jgi:serine/threonine protein phosphatase PrpC
VSEGWDTAAPSDFGPTSGPSLSYAFNLAKIPNQGEDSDPILRDGPDLGLIGVFDGMGGAGGTVYETPDGPRTGAYLASRVARDVVERRMLDLLEPDWNLNGEAAAEDIRCSVKKALEDRLTELKAPPSRLRSKLLRALPTTMAVVALQRRRRADSTWSGHVFWAGDSRAYAFTPGGAHQLSTDDLRDPGDAMANLHHDSVVSNAMSADTEFRVGYRGVELKAPFLLVCATDGCFGYVPTPMHFEHLVLKALAGARSTQAWSEAVQAEISAVTGDDAAMAVLGVGADLAEFQALLAPRLATLEEDFIGPLDQLRRTVQEAERTLQAARQHEQNETAALWGRYQPDYERHLRPPVTDDEPRDEQADADADGPTAEDVRTPVEGHADGVEERPDAAEQPDADAPPAEATLDRPAEVV